MLTFTDLELRAYLAEELSVARSSELERELVADEALRQRLRNLLEESDAASLAVRDVWLRGRLSCPSRSTLSDFLEGRLGDGLGQYVRFHLEDVGCRFCAANLADLRGQGGPDADQRNRKFFETSVGRLKDIPQPDAV